MTMNLLFNPSAITLALFVSASGSDINTDGSTLTAGDPLYSRRRPTKIFTAEQQSKTIFPLEAGEQHDSSESDASPNIGFLRGGNSRSLQHGNMHYSDVDHQQSFDPSSATNQYPYNYQHGNMHYSDVDHQQSFVPSPATNQYPYNYQHGNMNYSDVNHHGYGQSFVPSPATNQYPYNYDYGDGSMMCGGSCKPGTCMCMTDIFLETSDVNCANEINAVCSGVPVADGTAWNIPGCIVGYAYNNSWDLLCSAAKCRANGGSFESCWSQPINGAPSVGSAQLLSVGQTPSNDGSIIAHGCRVGAVFSLATAIAAWTILN